jgi:hypothetical protein
MPNSSGDAPPAPNLESYTNNGNGTVTDDVTGLMWQQTPAGDAGAYPTFSWAAAPGYCASLALASHQDWRLPTLIELLSIVDDAVNGPSINTTYFPGTPSTSFWSSTPTAASSGTGSWSVDFSYGEPNISAPVNAFAVRCVRGGASPFASSPGPAPPGRYTTTGSGAATTVYDTKTGLTWLQTVPASMYTSGLASTAGTAQNYCATLGVGGTGWRLPTVRELATLVDYSQTGAAAAMIDAAYFPSTPSGYFWSTTSAPWLPSYGKLLDFGHGYFNVYADSSSYSVRCVR